MASSCANGGRVAYHFGGLAIRPITGGTCAAKGQVPRRGVRRWPPKAQGKAPTAAIEPPASQDAGSREPGAHRLVCPDDGDNVALS